MRARERTIVDSFFLCRSPLMQHQIASVNRLFSADLEDMIASTRPFIIATDRRRHTYTCIDHRLVQPTHTESDGSMHPIFPYDARVRGLTYAATLMVSFCRKTDEIARTSADSDHYEVTKENVATYNFPLVFAGRIPVMVLSSLCRLTPELDAVDPSTHPEKLASLKEGMYEQGGYFVVKGKERVIISQERLAADRIFCYYNTKTDDYYVQIHSRKHGTARGAQDTRLRIKNVRGATGPIVVLQIPYVGKEVNVAMVIKALYEMTDHDIAMYAGLLGEERSGMLDVMQHTFGETRLFPKPDDCNAYIGARCMLKHTSRFDGNPRKNRIANSVRVLDYELLPHIGTGPDSRREKAMFLCHMIVVLLETKFGWRRPDDRDHRGNKAIDTAGALLYSLLVTGWSSAVNDLKRNLTQSASKYRETGGKSKFNESLPFEGSIITNMMEKAISTGNWPGAKKGGVPSKTGVTQALDRLTFSATLSNCRRVNSSIGRQGSAPKPRQMHGTQWGAICPTETPEGISCGLVTNLALMCRITRDIRCHVILIEIFNNTHGFYPLDEISSSNMVLTKVFLDGRWIGMTATAEKLVAELRVFRRTVAADDDDQKRRGGSDDDDDPSDLLDISIYWNIENHEIDVRCDAGRCARPLLLVNQATQELVCTKAIFDRISRSNACLQRFEVPRPGERLLNWHRSMKKGIMEYVDIKEEENTLIAMFHSPLRGVGGNDSRDMIYTHCEIHPSMILGVSGSVIPFPDHNQSPRNTYQSAMGKQAMGIYTTALRMRFDTMSHILRYPQKPLCVTSAFDLMHLDVMGTGTNATVAICCMGYNQEDSNMTNQSSIDRGLFRNDTTTCITDTQDNLSNTAKIGASRGRASGGGGGKKKNILEQAGMQQFCKPIKATTLNMKQAATAVDVYGGLDEDGLPHPGSRIAPDHVVIGKRENIPEVPTVGTNSLRLNRTGLATGTDKSTTLDKDQPHIVLQTMLTEDRNGQRRATVKLTTVHVPQIGDKFSSRHGQKGTIGLTVRQEDMPFTADGIVPDIIINPHAIPSRMTIAQLVESIGGKVAAITGHQIDATPFSMLTVDQCKQQLHKCGMVGSGNERMYNGHTGKPLEGMIFIGPVFYQRLRHLVDEKINCRSRGPMTLLTRQPTSGRARDGGLRFGEMERDCLISHGCAAMLRERLMWVSDAFNVNVCHVCGLIMAPYRPNRPHRPHVQRVECKQCKSTDTSEVWLPYACKLLFQELMAMAIAPRMRLTDIHEGRENEWKSTNPTAFDFVLP
jgi:DNA-directed RNA polymerase II subunit RPB2